MSISSFVPEQWYYRNPTLVSFSFLAQGIAPHGQVVRASYTVPAGKSLHVTSVYLLMDRVTAAPGAGGRAVNAFIVGGIAVIEADLLQIEIAVKDKILVVINPDAYFPSGSVLTLQTVDLMGGGTIDYIGIVSGYIFDSV